MGSVLIVSNRLPYTAAVRRDGVRLVASTGGLATGLSSVYRQGRTLWVGWPGVPADRLELSQRQQLTRVLWEKGCVPVFLDEQEVQEFYLGFCNRSIWPLFHYFPQQAVHERSLWEAYRRVNQRFADVVAELATPESTIWVHDYQLMLLPALLRARLPRAAIGFFLHIPFPAFEVFRMLPWRRELLEGVLGADLVGFHTHEYCLHFLDCVQRLVGGQQRLGYLTVGGRLVRVEAFPMGIDYERFAGAQDLPEVRREIDRLRQQLRGLRVVLSVSRLDYSKGIPQRLAAFDLLLERHPELREQVTLVLVAVPSRTEVPAYQALKRQVEEQVGQINGKHGTLGWMPVWYLYRAVPFATLAALYRLAHVALVTPFRDGMNLIAKEFVASKTDGRGVLILSEMAGAAREMTEALLVNPYDVEAIEDALYRALCMPEDEQVARNRLMQERLRQFPVQRWAMEFVEQLRQAHGLQEEMTGRASTEQVRAELVREYRQARRRLLVLDYDGTLVPFAPRPDQAAPDPALLDLLGRLCADPRNTVVLVSGRDRHSLERWFGELTVGLAAEHGVWVREGAGPWKLAQEVSDEWKRDVYPILEAYATLTPGAFVEEKGFSLVWHYRGVEQKLAETRSRELKGTLAMLTAPLDVGVLDADRALEVKPLQAHKGRAVRRWLEAGARGGRGYDFVLAAGDDFSDEDMFAAVEPYGWTVRARPGPTRARFWVQGYRQVRELLEELAAGGHRPG